MQTHHQQRKNRVFLFFFCSSSASANYLNKDGAIGVGMRIDGASGSLTADVASEGDSHPPARRFGEEGPREGGHTVRTRSSPGASRSHGTFHSRISGPASHGSRTQHQSHGRLLVPITTKTVSHSITPIAPKLSQYRNSRHRSKRSPRENLPWRECDC